MTVYQLQAVGRGWTGQHRRMYNTVVHATKELAESRVEAFRVAISDIIVDELEVSVVPLEVVQEKQSLFPWLRDLFPETFKRA